MLEGWAGWPLAVNLHAGSGYRHALAFGDPLHWAVLTRLCLRTKAVHSGEWGVQTWPRGRGVGAGRSHLTTGPGLHPSVKQAHPGTLPRQPNDNQELSLGGPGHLWGQLGQEASVGQGLGQGKALHHVTWEASHLGCLLPLASQSPPGSVPRPGRGCPLWQDTGRLPGLQRRQVWGWGELGQSSGVSKTLLGGGWEKKPSKGTSLTARKQENSLSLSLSLASP